MPVRVISHNEVWQLKELSEKSEGKLPGEERRDYLYEKLADILEYDIISRKYTDERLPSEQSLAESYKVSRTVIREALKILTERRLITTVVGSGAYITKPDCYDLSVVVNRLINTHEIDYAQAFDVRIILETAAAYRAAQRITDEELAKMEDLVNLLQTPGIPLEARNKYDFAFHMLIAEASHNQLLAMLVGAMSNIIYEIITYAVAAGTKEQDTQNKHQYIYLALKEHDATAAEHMAYDHLYKAKKYYMEYIKTNRPAMLKSIDASKSTQQKA